MVALLHYNYITFFGFFQVQKDDFFRDFFEKLQYMKEKYVVEGSVKAVEMVD